MHYIAGTTITVTSQGSAKIRPGMTSSQIRQMSSGVSGFKTQRDQLTPQERYSLLRIHNKDEKVCYVFADRSGTRVELLFDTVSQAEKFISEIKGEQLPDYSAAYDNQTH